MKSLGQMSLCGYVLLTLSPGGLSQDNIEGPWGTANGDLFGRARTTDIPVLFGNGGGAAEAWRISTTANGSNRSAGYTSLTFDAAGNIYWRSFTGQLSSVNKNGTWRWNATTDGSTVINLGGFTDSSAVVGGAAVYVLGGGAAGNDYVAAINKATGVRIWQTALPNADYSSRDQLTPVLYNGKLYILGRSNGFNCEVYRVNAADGALDWNNTVDITVLLKGCMTFVPDAFASGEHGLYVNGDSGSGTDFFGEAYGIKITATAASLIWEVDGGKAARSHLIYNPVTDLLYSHTWHDYGGEFYAYDPQNGNVTVNNNTTDAGHGFYDVGCLDFDNNSIVTGGFSGQVVIYQDTGGGTTTDQVYTYSDGQCPTSWYGEYRVYGQLLCCNGETVLVSGTNSRNNDLGATYKARAAVMKVPGNIPAEDSAMYIDDVVVSEGPDVNNLTQIFADDFESYTLGDLPPQGGWEDDPGAPQTDVAKVVDDPTGADPNQCAAIDAAGGGGGWVGMYHNFTDSTQDVVRIQWRQYREGMGDNAWPYYGDFAGDFAGGWNFGWDINDGRYFAYHFGGGQVKPERCFWQTVTVTYSNINDPTPANRTVTIDIDNPAQSASATQDQGFNQTDAIYGVGFELEATPPVDGGDYNDPWVAFDTQIANDHGFTTRSGVLAGPDGKLYYMHANTAELVALEPDLPVRDEYFERWEQSSPNDQSTTDTDPDTPGKQPAHSGLAGAPGAEGVRDNQLADAARAAVKGGAKFVWAFGQCFGAGFFDELNALGGTQAMSSAAQHYQVSRYPEPPADGNGIDWIKAYLKALVAGGSVALPLADASARNDPWGPNPTPDPPRVNETGGSEQPVYHETIPAAGAIDLADGGDERFAVIWAGGALRQIDVEEVIDAVDRLIVGLGFARDRIFVFIDDGRISAEHPLSRLPARQIRKPNRIGLENLFTQLNAVRNRCKLPPLVLFLAVGHGFNTDPRCGGDRPRDGGGSYEPADGLDGDYGSGDDLSYGDIEPWCPREDSSNEPALPQGIRRW